MSHFIERCEHGTVVRQCRCPGPKVERIVKPCPFGHVADSGEGERPVSRDEIAVLAVAAAAASSLPAATTDEPGLRELARQLADEAARAVTEPRRFHENEDGRQQALGHALTAVRRALAASDGSLDVAWREAEEALPDGWFGPCVAPDAASERYVAWAWAPNGADEEDRPAETLADTPTAALRELATYLRPDTTSKDKEDGADG